MTFTGRDRARLLVVYNPVAGRWHGRTYRRTLERLAAAGAQCDVRLTAVRGDAERIAREAVGGGYDAVVAAGGDGTIDEVVNGLAGEAVPLGLIPLGTANVLAHEIGLTVSPEPIARTILEGPVLRAYAGRAGDRLFTVMAGIGFDATVVEDVSLRLKRRVGKLAYGVAAVRAWLRFASAPLDIVIDNVPRPASFAIVCKGRLYGGTFVCAPDASITEPTFEIVLVEQPGRRGLIRASLALARGTLDTTRGVRVVRGREVVVRGPVGIPVQGDGDIVARVPLTISVAPRPVGIIVPELFALKPARVVPISPLGRPLAEDG